MKAKIPCLLFAVLLTCSLSALAESVDDPPRGQNALRKLGRGLANITFGFIELPNQYTKVNSEHGGAGAMTYGVGKGLLRWLGRELVGVYEVVTFPIPLPKGYKPIMKPEFPIEDYEP